MSDLPPDLPDFDDVLDWLEDVVHDWGGEPDADVVSDAEAELETELDDLAHDAIDDLADDGTDAGLADVELELDLAPGAELDGELPAEPAGTCSAASLGEALGLLGAEDAADVLAAAGGDLESRTAVAVLDEAGVSARVEHSTLGDLAEHLAAGIEVILGGGGGPAHAVVAIERDGSLVVEALADGGNRRTIALEHFEAMWEATANEVMVVDTPSGSVSFGPGEIVVIPLGVDELAGVGGI